jgi:hypothetical protein
MASARSPLTLLAGCIVRPIFSIRPTPHAEARPDSQVNTQVQLRRTISVPWVLARHLNSFGKAKFLLPSTPLGITHESVC